MRISLVPPTKLRWRPDNAARSVESQPWRAPTPRLAGPVSVGTLRPRTQRPAARRSDPWALLAGDLELGHLQPRDLELLDGQTLDAHPPERQPAECHSAYRERTDRDGRHRGRSPQPWAADVCAGDAKRQTFDHGPLSSCGHGESVSEITATAQARLTAAFATSAAADQRNATPGRPYRSDRRRPSRPPGRVRDDDGQPIGRRRRGVVGKTSSRRATLRS
jgi:hypothetical protein